MQRHPLLQSLARSVAAGAILCLAAVGPALAFDAEALAARFKTLGVKVSNEEATPQTVVKMTYVSLPWEIRVHDEDIALMAGLPKLQSLDLGGRRELTPAIIPFLAEMPALQRLSLNSLHIGDEGAAQLGQMTGLRDLSLSSARGLSPKGIAALAKSRSIRRLKLFDVTVGDEGLAALATMPQLEDLQLTRARGVTPAGLRELAKLMKLRKLDIAET